MKVLRLCCGVAAMIGGGREGGRVFLLMQAQASLRPFLYFLVSWEGMWWWAPHLNRLIKFLLVGGSEGREGGRARSDRLCVCECVLCIFIRY